MRRASAEARGSAGARGMSVTARGPEEAQTPVAVLASVGVCVSEPASASAVVAMAVPLRLLCVIFLRAGWSRRQTDRPSQYKKARGSARDHLGQENVHFVLAAPAVVVAVVVVVV